VQERVSSDPGRKRVASLFNIRGSVLRRMQEAFAKTPPGPSCTATAFTGLRNLVSLPQLYDGETPRVDVSAWPRLISAEERRCTGPA